MLSSAAPDDALNRQAKVQDQWGLTLTYAYDPSDNRTGVLDSNGGLATMTLASTNYLSHTARPGRYDGFDKIVTDTTGATGNVFKYTGHQWDATAQLQYNRARYYMGEGHHSIGFA